jgi:hypothetical protein
LGINDMGCKRLGWIDLLSTDQSGELLIEDRQFLDKKRHSDSESLCFWTLSIVRNSKYKKAQRFGNWICFRSQVRRGDTYSVGSLRKS